MLAAYYMGHPGQARGVDRLGNFSGGRHRRRRAAGAYHLHHSNVGLVRAEGVSCRCAWRFGSIPGAVVGGVLIGVIESMAGFYLPQGWKDVAPYVVLLVVLAAEARRPVRPSYAQEGLV